MNTDNHFQSNEQESIHEIMNFFRCNTDMAKTILQSSEMNGQIENIKRMCRDNAQREENE